MRNLLIAITLSSLCLYSCKDTSDISEDHGDSISKVTFQKEQTKVRTAVVKQGNFNLEVISNGKATAVNNAEIRFPISEKIQVIYVKNGDRVHKGQLLALLNADELEKRVVRSKAAVDKALIDLDDRLIDYGYRLKDSVRVPAVIMQMAKTRSGYNNAMYDYSDAKTALGKTRITAPFPGKIADMEARVFNNTDAFRKLCTLIDDTHMQVEFNVLESEYRFLAIGSIISVTPYGTDDVITGRVSQVNPVIDASGMIRIVGSVNNVRDQLLNGMNVKITVKRAIGGKIFVPKEAILQRQDRNVVFTYENSRAKWNYVETGPQNSSFTTILSGLKPGQQVIISNNTNLAHDAAVVLDDQETETE